MDKKIVPGCFRDLNEEEVRVFFMRHGAHKDNMLTTEAIAQSTATGEALKVSGIVISATISSPSPRALETNLKVQHGYGKRCYINTDPRIADMSGDPNAILALNAIKERVETRGFTWGDPGIAQVAYDPEENFLELMTARGENGATAIIEAFNHLSGKTLLVTSHGVAMIEAAIMSLREEKIHVPERLADTGQIIELIFDADDNLIEEHWLETVQVSEKAAQ